MYASFFGLKHEPFSIAPDPRYLFMSERHREALAHLLYGVKGAGGGFVLLTGEIGAGKTTVCRCLLEQIPKRCNVAYIFNPKLTALELLKTVCDEFHVPYKHEGAGHADGQGLPRPAERVPAARRTRSACNNVLIIDEAQNLSADVLEQLRLLTNLETNERKLLQIVLIGQPELRTMLAPARAGTAGAARDRALPPRCADRGRDGAVPAPPPGRRRPDRRQPVLAGARCSASTSARAACRGASTCSPTARCSAPMPTAWRASIRRIVDKAAAEVFGPDERLAALRRVAPWGIGVVAGAALAGRRRAVVAARAPQAPRPRWRQRPRPAAPSWRAPPRRPRRRCCPAPPPVRRRPARVHRARSRPHRTGLPHRGGVDHALRESAARARPMPGVSWRRCGGIGAARRQRGGPLQPRRLRPGNASGAATAACR